MNTSVGSWPAVSAGGAVEQLPAPSGSTQAGRNAGAIPFEVVKSNLQQFVGLLENGKLTTNDEKMTIEREAHIFSYP